MNMLKPCLTLFLLASFSTFANTECVDCDTHLEGLSEIPAEVAAMHTAVDSTVQDLANAICNNMIVFYDTEAGESWEAFQNPVLPHLGVSTEDVSYRSKITEFWNKFQDKMICTDEHPGYDSPQHLLKRVVDMNTISSFFFDYFLRDPNMQINAVEIVDGKKQTLLDYLDLIINNPDLHDLYSMGEVNILRNYIVQVSKAKRGDEL